MTVTVVHFVVAATALVFALCRLGVFGFVGRSLAYGPAGHLKIVVLLALVSCTIGMGLMERRKWGRRLALIFNGSFGILSAFFFFVMCIGWAISTHAWPDHPSGFAAFYICSASLVACMFNVAVLIRKKVAAEFLTEPNSLRIPRPIWFGVVAMLMVLWVWLPYYEKQVAIREMERLEEFAAQEQKKAVAAIKKLGGKVTIDEHNPNSLTQVDFNSTKVTDEDLVHLKGLKFLSELYLNDTKITDEGLKHLKGTYLKDLKGTYLKGTKLIRLELSDTKITDSGLEHLKGLLVMNWLDLQNTKITDSGLEHLKGLRRLQVLKFSNAEITDAGLEHLKGLTNLKLLILNGTNVSDAGLEHLKGLTKLEMLGLKNTNVTDDGVKKLKMALPNCRIGH